MRFSFAHVALAIGLAWLLINLGAIAFLTALFYVDQAWSLVRRRRHLRTARLAPVICITSRARAC
jgi:hypothetical protein